MCDLIVPMDQEMMLPMPDSYLKSYVVLSGRRKSSKIAHYERNSALGLSLLTN